MLHEIQLHRRRTGQIGRLDISSKLIICGIAFKLIVCNGCSGAGLSTGLARYYKAPILASLSVPFIDEEMEQLTASTPSEVSRPLLHAYIVHV